MGRYRKKPVVIEAFQLDERGLVAEDWFWDAVTRNDIITYNFGKWHTEPAWCEIKTLEGTMTAKTGDYIIRGVNGEIYPCKPDIFEKTYEIEGEVKKMGRLIDADALLKKICKQFNISNDWDGDISEPLQTVIDIIDNFETSYDVEKVVAELESRKELLNMANISTKQKNVGQNAYNIAIGIIKAGGKEVNED